MKRLSIIILILFFSILKSHSQNESKSESEKVSISLYPSSHTELWFEKEIEKLISWNSLREKPQLENFKKYENLYNKRDSIKIVLNSGTNWYLKDGPPKKPSFFLFKLIFNKLDSIEMDRVYYIEMLEYFENDRKLPVNKMNKICYKEYYLDEKEVQLIFENEIKLDSTKRFGSFKQEIIYRKNTTQ